MSVRGRQPVRISASLSPQTHYTTTRTYRQRYHDKEDKAAAWFVLAGLAEAASCAFAQNKNAIGTIMHSYLHAPTLVSPSLISPHPFHRRLSTWASVSLPGRSRAVAGEARRHCRQRNKSATSYGLPPLSRAPPCFLVFRRPGALLLSLRPLLQPCPHGPLLDLLRHLPTTY